MRPFPLLVMFGLILAAGVPARADTVSAAITGADAHFAAARYDSAAAAYEPALQELARQGRWSDLKFLLRDLSDRFYRENRRYQPRPDVTVGHGTYVKLSTHAERLFTRYCELVADRDPQPDEKLATLGDQLLEKQDFRGRVAHEILGRRFPHSRHAARSLYRAGYAADHAIHQRPEAAKAHAQSLLEEVVSRYPTSEYCDDALHALGTLALEEYQQWTSLASRWKTRAAEISNPATKERAERELAVLQAKLGSLAQVEADGQRAWEKACAYFSRAVTDYPSGDRTPFCLGDRAYLHLLRGDRDAARRDCLLLASKYPREKRVAETLLKKYGL